MSARFKFIAYLIVMIILFVGSIEYVRYATSQMRYASIKLNCLQIKGTDVDYCEKLAQSVK